MRRIRKSRFHDIDELHVGKARSSEENSDWSHLLTQSLRWVRSNGRDKTIQILHYYRRLINQRSWTPWEKVELDIDGKEDSDNTGVQLLPFVWRGRLFLFWTTLTQKSYPPPYPHISAADGATPREGKQYLEIKLFWSSYDHGRWGKKRAASVAPKYPPS